MEIPIYQVDAFSNKIFQGNPAAICPLTEWLDDDLLLNIAQENNLAETAYFIPTNDGFHLRWFTPEIEMDLCGHATLATAHVIFTHLDYQQDVVKFHTASGLLSVTRNGDLMTMDLPSWPPQSAVLPDEILKGIGVSPQLVLKERDYLMVYDTQEDVLAINPDQNFLKNIDLGTGGIIVTAPGEDVDFVSRFFTPGAAVFEDPVTGSAHSSLTPYWGARLKKSKMTAKQISPRGGLLHCELNGDRVLISGNAKTYLKGNIWC